MQILVNDTVDGIQRSPSAVTQDGRSSKWFQAGCEFDGFACLGLVTCNSDAISGPCWRSSCSHHHGSFDVVVAWNAAEHKLTTRAHGERHDNNQEEYFPLVLRLC